MKQDTKRQNFNVTPDQEAQVSWLKDNLEVSTTKDAFLRSVQVMSLLVRKCREGSELYLKSRDGRMTQLLIPELSSSGGWVYLTERPHPWRKQLYVKGRKLLASTVWGDMFANNMTEEDAAENWDLPMEAVREIVRYCEENEALIGMEADEERSRLIGLGVKVVA